MNVLVIGGSGMLGSDLVRELGERGHAVTAPSSSELDITNPESAARIAVKELGDFDWCVNCAAYTAVDKAESEKDQAYLINAIGPGYLGQSCSLASVKLLHVSTDFVFDGSASEPYSEDARTNPLGVYGSSKRKGEEDVLAACPGSIVARTSWLYGPNGNSFPRTMIRAYLAGKSLRVVADQLGCPTYTGDLARVLADLIEKNPFPGIYHTAGPDILSWHAFAKAAIEIYREEVLSDPGSVEIEPIATDDWPTPAKRPKYSAMSFDKVAALGIKPMRPVAEALRDFVRRLPVEL